MLNLFDEVYEVDNTVLDETMNFLSEAPAQSKRIIGTKEKKQIMLTRMELLLAQRAGDALYDKYKKATLIRRKCRKLIHDKYQSKAKLALKEYLKEKKAAASAK